MKTVRDHKGLGLSEWLIGAAWREASSKNAQPGTHQSRATGGQSQSIGGSLAAAIIGVVLFGLVAWANSGQADEYSLFMHVYGYTKPPVGHMHFCKRNPIECQAGPINDSRVELTRSLWSDLEQINYIVNRTVAPRSDHELYGISEHWAFPYHSGDSEDYVLLKRRMLMERGWPTSALLITVVRDESGRGHVVLIARTSRGDYLLDNKRNAVVAWYEAPYHYLKRQSYRNPRRWVSLVPKSEKKVFSTGGASPR